MVEHHLELAEIIFPHLRKRVNESANLLIETWDKWRPFFNIERDVAREYADQLMDYVDRSIQNFKEGESQ